MPRYPLPATVLDAIREQFPSAQTALAAQLLAAYDFDDSPMAPVDAIRHDILVLAAGNLVQLADLIKMAERDPRDILRAVQDHRRKRARTPD